MNVELQDGIDSRSAARALPSCHFCATPLRHTFVDLGMSPLCESYVHPERVEELATHGGSLRLYAQRRADAGHPVGSRVAELVECSSSRSTATATSRGSTCPAPNSRSATPRRSSTPGPDFIVILPWNLTQELVAQLSYAREWGTRFRRPIPEVKTL